MLELAGTRSEEDIAGPPRAHASPLMADDGPTMTRGRGGVHRPLAVEDASDADDDRGGYGADPLSRVQMGQNDRPNRLSTPPPQPPIIQSAQQSPAPIPQPANATMKRKLLLLLPLLLTLLLLTDSTTIQTNADINSRLQNKRHHLAFVTALARHPPSLRVFRLVGEGAWLLLCAAFALWVWEDAGREDGERIMSERGAPPVYSDGRGDREMGASVGDGWEANPTNKMDATRDEITNNSPRIPPGISPAAVGRLLFAPPPDSIAGNAAWTMYRRHRPLRRLRRRRKRSGSGGDDGEGGENGILFGEGSGDEMSSGYIGEVEVNDSLAQATTESEEGDAPVSPLPPSSAAVLGAALDVLTLTCMCLIFFTISSAEGGRYIDRRPNSGTEDNGGRTGESGHADEPWMKFIAKIAAPLFPLALFVLAAFLVVVPWRKRKAVWTIVSLTIGAPFYEVTFRDGFIGDILTSTVRPLQDLAFTVFFLPLGLRAWWGRELYTLDAAAIPLERSWMLHTVVLPACTLSPLWWRFLQNLRQCYDAKERWPYLGNALKYMLAAEVAVFGLFDPTMKQSPLWLTFFLLATLYQIWWDVFMDWGLLERDPRFGYCLTTSNDGGGRWRRWWPYSLRARRLYRRTWVYRAIFGINFCLRFVGMLTLIPPHHLSRTTGLIVNTYNDPDFQLFAGSLVASAEIFRRTIWALLRLEWEVIKTESDSGKSDVAMRDNDDGFGKSLDDDEEMKPMAIASSAEGAGHLRGWPFAAKRPELSLASLIDMSGLNDIQVLSELSVWATIFSGIAIIAAAHREVL